MLPRVRLCRVKLRGKVRARARVRVKVRAQEAMVSGLFPGVRVGVHGVMVCQLASWSKGFRVRAQGGRWFRISSLNAGLGFDLG